MNRETGLKLANKTHGCFQASIVYRTHGFLRDLRRGVLKFGRLEAIHSRLVTDRLVPSGWRCVVTLSLVKQKGRNPAR